MGLLEETTNNLSTPQQSKTSEQQETPFKQVFKYLQL